MANFGFKKPFAGATNEEVRIFRHQVSTLKKAGLLPSTINTRTASPTQTIKGPRWGVESLQHRIAEFGAVLQGKATPVTLKSEKDIEHYRNQGYTVTKLEGTKPRVIVPHAPDEIVKVEKGSIVRIPGKGLKSVQIPIEYHNVDDYISQLKALKLDAGPDAYFGFNFFGGKSHMLFSNTSLLAEYFQHYKSRFSSTQWSQSFPQFEILKVSRARKNANWFDKIPKHSWKEWRARKKRESTPVAKRQHAKRQAAYRKRKRT
jgi:hypothetical protein